MRCLSFLILQVDQKSVGLLLIKLATLVKKMIVGSNNYINFGLNVVNDKFFFSHLGFIIIISIYLFYLRKYMFVTGRFMSSRWQCCQTYEIQSERSPERGLDTRHDKHIVRVLIIYYKSY